MKKIISIIAIISLLTILILPGCSFAEELNTIDVKTSNTTIRPGGDVTVTIDFGQSLGAYTFDIAYDDNIFEYVSAEGGTPNDTTDKVRVTFYDSTGGSNPRTNMSVTFRAKSDITTSNPTEFMITAEGLANADASVTFDDITTPIVKNVTVEPEYIDYTFKLEYTGDIIVNQEKEMTLTYSSPMGRYYEHARLVATVVEPTGADVKILGTDSGGLEHDIIESGWGDAQGYKIGGKDVSQVLNLRGVFSKTGAYKVTFKLIDRDNSDATIAEKTYQFTVTEIAQTTPEDTTPEENNPEETTPEQKPSQETPSTDVQEEKPDTLPKTGANIYIPVICVLVILVGCYVYYNRKHH